MLTVDQLTKKIKKNSSDVDLGKVEKAYDFAARYHKEQLRKSGVPYVQHPLSVAYQLADFQFDTDTFVAALLHDVIEDTKATPQLVSEEFGREVLKLVLGVTKLSRIQLGEKAKEYTIENLRRMFLAMAQDIRVVIIKLADRYHNLKTLKYLDSKKKTQKARETMEIYAPLAHRLGMGELKGELEDLAFLHLNPEEYKWVKTIVEEEIIRRQKNIEKITNDLKSKLDENNIKYTDVHGRAKHYYSLYKKLKKHEDNINNIYDLTALRVVVNNISDCYKTLGIVHQNWRPLLGRIKDYISIPKSNGYQSLHTTVLYPPNTTIEIQIRTPQMHFEAEYGVAAAWHYSEKEKPDAGAIVPKKLSWINELIKWQDELKDNKKFAEVLKIDFFRDRIFVFTPKGEVFDLPDGSTPIDFAYQIHSDIGDHCQMAKVNNKVAPFDYKLKNGDVIEILTSEKTHPKRDWLSFVHTNQAKDRIRDWLKKQNKDKNLKIGRVLLNQELLKIKKKSLKLTIGYKVRLNKALDELNYKTIDDLLIGIA
ncbi:MAG: bifunctional (p)ppGpp synthetase/guanosine-3',5'-bis(diphosphate) 3'-pyrophosphohydrolase, partial [Parcubacteria group bacterium]|nr:bifunctional (p)ppGpp synthetase/guanosine-3',5'-bis(diphosphate) 3'-pyrophosphohydrolase [Parcubacteria group bacterium]